MRLETERLLLRPFTEGDLDDVYAYAQSSQVGPNAGWKPHENRAESREVMRNHFLGKEDVWAIVLKERGRVIGSIGLVADPKRINDKARMIGYAIGEAYWGRGYMTEAARRVLCYAFETLCLPVVSVYCYPFNRRSMRVIEKCGFKFEGILRQAHVIYSGEVRDEACYSMTIDEYRVCPSGHVCDIGP